MARRILKLHGSINWSIPKGRRTEVSAYESAHSVIFDDLVPELLPPTWRKDALSTFSQIWREALRAIGEATRLIVIGFSMPPTDLHFRYLLAAGLSKNISLREILFIDPQVEQVQSRAQTVFANPEHNAARLKFRAGRVEEICVQGTESPGSSIARPLPPEIQSVSTRCVRW